MKHVRYRIEYTSEAVEALARLPKREADQITRKVARLEAGLRGDIKRLHGADVGFRLRMGNYRILFDVEQDVVVIQKIGHRKEVYD